MLKIRLVDLRPIFKELDLIGNPQLKLKIKVNAGYCDIAVAPLVASPASDGSLSLISTTMTSGNTVPVMLASAAAGNALAGCNTATTTLRLAFGPLQNNITTLAQAGQFLPFTTSRLNIPYYDLVNPLPIISSPIKTIRYLDCFAQYFRGKAGTGASTSQQNAPINLQLSGSWKNINKTLDYDFEAWNDEFRKLGAINGGFTHEISNGLIDFQKWQTVQRIMVADCSRISNKGVPQSVVVSGVNACCQGMNSLVLVINERELSIDRLTGEVQSWN
ncbi:unnamed protein product [Aphanomyces euteiches]